MKAISRIWKNNKKTIGKLLLCMAGMLVAGLILMIGVYMLPTGRMKGHVANSADTFNYEGEYPEIIQGYRNSILDNYTDALMYATAIQPGTGDVVQDAMRNRRYEDSGSNLAQSLNDYANDVAGKEAVRYEMEYPRYWHGYLVILKPLLLFFDIGEIRMFNMVIQGALLLLLLYLADKKVGGRSLIPLGMMLAVLNPVVLPLSLQYSWVYYIALISADILLCMKDPFRNKKYLFLFLAAGAATSYMDLLTYPLITLGLPAVCLFLLERERRWQTRLLRAVEVTALWGIGYGVMWFGKWVFAWLFGVSSMFADAFGEIGIRLSSTGEAEEALNAGMVLARNIGVIAKWPYILMLLMFFGICGYLYYKNRRNHFRKETLLYSLPYGVMILLPVVWLALLSNHSWVHSRYTYRELAVTVLAGSAMILKLWIPGDPAEKERQEQTGAEFLGDNGNEHKD